MKLPEYFSAFVRANWPQQSRKWEDITAELIEAASSGDGNAYCVATAGNLVLSRLAGEDPASLNYFGEAPR